MRDNAAIGRKAQYFGSSFEDWLALQHDKAKVLGILAHIEKTQAKTRVVNGRPIFAENGVADYIGCLERGQYLALEAKSTSDERFYLDGVSKKQQQHLEAVARAGGLSLLLVEFRLSDIRERFAVPWLQVPWKVLRKASSVSAFDLTGWLVESDCYLLRWHVGGVPSSPQLHCRRVFARE